MSEFGGLWKQQNNPASTKRVTVSKRVRVFVIVTISHYYEDADTFSESWTLYQGKKSVVMTLSLISFVFFFYFLSSFKPARRLSLL